ncbi:MAG: integrase family protein [Nitrospinota bacterium]|nr:integrase family protein [Nitrospinota bacterium]
MSLTERKIKYLEAGKSRQIVWDNGGFGVQIAPDGVKSFIFEYRFNEMTKLIVLGTYPAMDLETGRRQAVEAFKMIMKGADPEEKGLPAPQGGAVPANPEITKQTLGQFKEKASETLGQVKGKASETLDHIKSSETLGRFKGMASQKLEQIKQRVEKKVKQAQPKTPPVANNVIPLEKKIQPDVDKAVPSTPPPPPPLAPPKEPEVAVEEQKPASLKDKFGRVLNKGELKTLWSALGNSDMPPANQLAVKLLIITAQRTEEVIQARWSDVDLVSKWWTIPGEFTLNGKKHKVPLTNLALDLLRKIKEQSGMAGVLFPSPGRVTPIEVKSLEEDLRRAQVRFGLKPFTCGDLQNSAVGQMLDNDIPESTLYKLLNQDMPAELEKDAVKVTDSDLRKALEKLERQLPKAY